MLDVDVAAWDPVTWVLYALAALYATGFLWFWVRFETLERAAKRQGGEAIARYNAALRGFPNAVYAKMFGKRAFEVAKPEAGRTP